MLLSRIEKIIMAYMCDHPQAGDTLEGIAEWWVPAQEIKIQIENVKRSLSNLVKAGLILENTMSDGKVHYRINPAKLDLIRTLIGKESL